MEFTVIQSGRRQVIAAQPGESVWSAIVREGLVLAAPCGGRGTCGQCRVRAVGGGEIAQHERALLGESELAGGVRLACALPATQGLLVELPEESGAAIVTDGLSARAWAHNPSVHTGRITVPPATLHDARSDLYRLNEAAGARGATVGFLASLPEALTGAETAARWWDDEWIDLGRERAYGIALDIGTTTLAAYLVDLTTGRTQDVRAALNPQRSLGADVISRVQYGQTPEARAQLRDLMIQAINDLVAAFCAENQLESDDLLHMTVAGNPAMLHLLLGVPAAKMAVTPFVPAFSGRMDIPCEALRLHLNPRGRVTLLPGVSAYVGADTVAAVLSSDMHRLPGIHLLLDIGTNGEMVLGGRDGLTTCSTAAGPAFEGAHIACGMGGVSGAIHRVRRDGETLICDVLGGGEALGLCGSGLVDALAVALEAEWIDESGRIDGSMVPESLRLEIDGKPAIRLIGRAYLTQKDVREVQLAKAAIAAGIEVLLDEMGVTLAQVESLHLAGGFGTNINVASACALGLLPPELHSKVKPIGNAAGAGARQALCDAASLEETTDIARKMRYIELSNRADFQEKFVDQMCFPDPDA